MAFSGSVDGRSGSVIKPAPSIFRLVREDERLLRRDPESARLIGDEPVPVVIWLELRAETGVDTGDDAATPAALFFGSAWPQTSQ